jgi:hypothetical protein
VEKDQLDETTKKERRMSQKREKTKKKKKLPASTLALIFHFSHSSFVSPIHRGSCLNSIPIVDVRVGRVVVTFRNSKTKVDGGKLSGSQVSKLVHFEGEGVALGIHAVDVVKVVPPDVVANQDLLTIVGLVVLLNPLLEQDLVLLLRESCTKQSEREF